MTRGRSLADALPQGDLEESRFWDRCFAAVLGTAIKWNTPQYAVTKASLVATMAVQERRAALAAKDK